MGVVQEAQRACYLRSISPQPALERKNCARTEGAAAPRPALPAPQQVTGVTPVDRLPSHVADGP
jgi:hypothetical protein